MGSWSGCLWRCDRSPSAHGAGRPKLDFNAGFRFALTAPRGGMSAFHSLRTFASSRGVKGGPREPLDHDSGRAFPGKGKPRLVKTLRS